ncbi:MAG: OmpH family outer membrane protein, partial [Deltaproteobacteria bacterium]|nr:OmpH family outer membrane protein [Deltaproteobacteria bacterium]
RTIIKEFSPMRGLSILSLIIFCLSAGSALAAEYKIGFFNMAVVIRDSDAYKAKLAEFQKEFDAEDKRLQKQGGDLQKKINDFQIQQQALSPKAREERELDLSRQKRDLDDKMGMYLRRRGEAEKRAQEEINNVIVYAASEYGKREKFSFVLEQNTAGVVWMMDSLDLTKQVLEESNKVWKARPKEVFGQQGQ